MRYLQLNVLILVIVLSQQLFLACSTKDNSDKPPVTVNVNNPPTQAPSTTQHMKFYTYLDAMALTLQINRYANANFGNFTAYIEGAKFPGTDSTSLVVLMGLGATPDEAIKSYLTQIRGKKMTFEATTTTPKREFIVPLDMEL